MAVYKRKYYWGRKSYNTKTGLYKGEKSHNSDGSVKDWMGNKVKQPSGPSKT